MFQHVVQDFKRKQTNVPELTAQIIKFYENVVIHQKLKDFFKRFPVAMATGKSITAFVDCQFLAVDQINKNLTFRLYRNRIRAGGPFAFFFTDSVELMRAGRDVSRRQTSSDRSGAMAVRLPPTLSWSEQRAALRHKIPVARPENCIKSTPPDATK